MINFTELEITASEPIEDYNLPSYGKKGRMLVEITNVLEPNEGIYRYEYENFDYDGDTSIHWLLEGIGLDYFLSEILGPDRITAPGWYVVEGVYGEYTRGDGWWTDDRENWYYDAVRPATEEEVKTGELEEVK